MNILLHQCKGNLAVGIHMFANDKFLPKIFVKVSYLNYLLKYHSIYAMIGLCSYVSFLGKDGGLKKS